MNTKRITSIALIGFLTLTTYALMAQSPGPGGSGGSPAGAPIDGGAIALLAGAAAYGYRKMKERKEEK